MGHEITHVLKGSNLFDGLQNTLFDYARAKGEYDTRLESLKETYKGIENVDVNEELTADLVGDYLFTDRNFVEHLLSTDRNVFEKIYDEIKYLCKIATTGSKEGKALLKAKKIFDDVYREGKKSDVEGTKYDIIALENGNVYVKASRNVIQGTTKSEQRRSITDFFNALLDEKPSLDIHTIEGDVLTITKQDTAQKSKDEYKTVKGYAVPLSSDEFLVKLRAAAHIDEIAETSTKKDNHIYPDNKNHPFAKDGFTYRKAYFQDFDGKYYELTLSVGHNGTVATVYNIGKIKESDIPSAKIIAVVGSKPSSTSLSNTIIRNSAEKSTRKFSLSSDTEIAPEGNFKITSDDVTLKAKSVLGDDIPIRKDITNKVNSKNVLDDDIPIREDIKKISSDKNNINYRNYTDKDFQDNAKTLVSMESVKDLTGNELSNKSIPLKQRISNFFSSLGNKVKTKQFGEVALNNSSLHDDLGHGLTFNKVVSFEAIPEVLQNGVVIDSQTRGNGNYERIIVAAPITISNEPCYMGVMLQRDFQSQRLYLHDVVTVKQIEALSLSETTPNTTEVSDKGTSLYMTSILQKAVLVNSKDMQTSKDTFTKEEHKTDTDSLESNTNNLNTEQKPKNLSTRQELHNKKIEDIKNSFSEQGFDFDDVLSKAKDLSTFATVDNTPQRVMENK